MGRTENLIDPPLTEEDANALFVFYEEFLKKDDHDALSFLKAVTLLRRIDLREYVHSFAVMRKRIEVMLRETRQRDMLLSYPSTLQRVHELLWEGEEAYGTEGNTVMSILGGQAGDYLDQTEMFRVDLDSLLADCPSLLPGDRKALEAAIAARSGAFLFLLVALADHVFISLLPYDHPLPNESVSVIRNFLVERWGEKFDDQIVEFFPLGGGYLRVLGSRIVLCGVHPVFDPMFEELGKPDSDRLFTDFMHRKFRLSLDTLRAELPKHQFIVQG